LKTGFNSDLTRWWRLTVTLDKTPYGTEARVVSISGYGAVALRLMQMGVVPGVSLSVVKSAPLGDPIQVRLRDYDLAMRRVEAQTITVALGND
jgi:Fe2+ transport system protein FeoA